MIMKVEYINPFLQAIQSVFSTMLGWELERGQIYARDAFQPEHEVSGIISLSGRAAGTVVLSLSRQTALAVAEGMLGEPAKEINANVTDAVGELANMVAGSAKAKLEAWQLKISIPTVITGKSYCIEFPKGVPRICVPFESPAGSLTLEVGFRELTADESTSAEPATAQA